MKECPMCGEVVDDLVLWKRKNKLVKTCADCKEQDNKLSSDFYEKSKRREEEERKKNNQAVLRSYRIKP